MNARGRRARARGGLEASVRSTRHREELMVWEWREETAPGSGKKESRTRLAGDDRYIGSPTRVTTEVPRLWCLHVRDRAAARSVVSGVDVDRRSVDVRARDTARCARMCVARTEIRVLCIHRGGELGTLTLTPEAAPAGAIYCARHIIVAPGQR